MTNPDDFDLDAYLRQRRQIAHIWSTEDVREVRPDLDDDQAWEVLQAADADLNSELGICWTTLEIIAEELFPEPDADETTPASRRRR